MIAISSNKLTNIGNKSIGNQMEIKSNIKIATLRFLLVLKKLGDISALRYEVYYSCNSHHYTHITFVILVITEALLA